MKQLIAACVLYLLIAAPAIADEHLHGVASVNFVLEGANLGIDLEIPAIDAVGFESAPQDLMLKDAVAKVAEMMERGGNFFRFTPEAKCEMKTSRAGRVEQEDGHSGFHAAYKYECKSPEKLKGVKLRLFTYFPALINIEIQADTPAGQKSGEVTSGNPLFSF